MADAPDPSRLSSIKAKQKQKEAAKRATEIFKIIDTDDSQSLSPDELLCYLLEKGQEPEEVSSLFKHLDQDGDGTISLDEWVAGYAWANSALSDVAGRTDSEVIKKATAMQAAIRGRQSRQSTEALKTPRANEAPAAEQRDANGGSAETEG